LHVSLIQEFQISVSVATRLAKAYGGRARDVLQLAITEFGFENRDELILESFPIIKAEIIYSIRYEWVVKIEDFLCRRTRIAFLNKKKCLKAIPIVGQIMGKELKWSHEKVEDEIKKSFIYFEHFSGPLSTLETNI
jgi:glycerol-3-phosphate dehydrogenase